MAASDLPRIVIWGASGHARVVADIVRLVGEFEIVGFLDDLSPARCGEPFCGATVLGGREQLEPLRAAGVTHALVAIGNCVARLALANLLRVQAFQLASAIHPHSTIAGDVRVGPGTVVMASAVVNAGAQLGECVIINTSASVDHECMIGDGVHISPGAHLGGLVTVGRGAHIGLGATVRDRVKIGARTVVGMGSVVVSNLPANVVAYGVPARIVREVAPDDGS